MKKDEETQTEVIRKEKNTLSKNIFIAILILILIGIVLLMIFISILAGTKKNPNTIINKFEKNRVLFEEVEKELEIFDNIDIRKDGQEIKICMLEKTKDKIKNIEVPKKDFYKYEKSINLLNKLKLECMVKSYDNIIFQFNATLRLSQEIVKMNDREKYENSGHTITNIREFSNNWYYIETK